MTYRSSQMYVFCEPNLLVLLSRPSFLPKTSMCKYLVVNCSKISCKTIRLWWDQYKEVCAGYQENIGSIYCFGAQEGLFGEEVINEVSLGDIEIIRRS